jgi:pyruvate kinase
MPEIEIMATLWPEMDHYRYFARDSRIKGIRLNTAKASVETIASLTKQALDGSFGTPLYFDVKGRQLRVEHVDPCEDHLELDLNHSITVDTPCVVLFKGGTDVALLDRVVDGKRLIFRGGPHYMVTPGDSLNIRGPSLKVHGDLFPPKQLAFLEVAKKAGITRFMLSYAKTAKEIKELQDIVGKECEIFAKIEDQAGVDFAKREWNSLSGKFGEFYKFNEPREKVSILTARGDLFVELDKPHQILAATRDLIRLDRKAIAGSRILLSVTEEEVPSCADLNEIAWLLEIGYRRFMFCDGLCLDKKALDRAVTILETVADEY